MTLRSPDRSRIAWRSIAAAVCAAGMLVTAGQAQQAPSVSDKASAKDEKVDPKIQRAADDEYLAGARLLDRGDLQAAEDHFDKAATLNPKNPDYIQAAALARQHRVTELVQQSGKARLQGDPKKAQQLLDAALRLDPTNPIVTQHLDLPAAVTTFRPELTAVDNASPSGWSLSAAKIAGPISLSPKPESQSFKIQADSRQVIRQVLERYGIQAEFDESIENKNLRFELEDVSYERATGVLFDMTGVFAVPLNAHSVLIAKDNNENRQRFERLLEETIYLPGLSTEEINEIGTAVRNVFDIKQATIQVNGGSIALRAPEDTLTAINLTLADLLDGSAEITLDMSLYTVSRTRQRNIGAQLPQQIGVYNVETEANNLVQSNQTIVDQAIAQGLIPANASNTTIALALIASGLVSSSLLSNSIGFFGGGMTMTGITANTATTFNLALNSSDTRALDSMKLRVTDRQTGILRSGMKYPIITSTYTGTSASSTSSLAGTTINGTSASSLLQQYLGSASTLTVPQIQYQDIGLELKATPTVQRSGLLRLKLDLKIQNLSGSSINNIPILVNRQFTSDIEVKDGGTALLASSLSKSESAAISGLPGLGELPGFQTATADKMTEVDSDELILLITPHIVRKRSNAIAGPRIAYNQRLPN